MQPNRLKKLIKQGNVETYSSGQFFYSLDFKEELYIVKKGFVKRYSIFEDMSRVIESIYGPDYIFPLTAAYTKLLEYTLSQESGKYVYQAMTDLEIQGISSQKLIEAVESDPTIYKDLFYEAGVRLKANINRLASNALKSDYQKVTHQIAYLADEFGDVKHKGIKTNLRITVPLEPIDMAEQLNIATDIAENIMTSLVDAGLISVKDKIITIPDLNLLKDTYLRRMHDV